MLLLSSSRNNLKCHMVDNVKTYVVLKLDMYELAMKTTSEYAKYDPLQYHLYVLYHKHMNTKKESTKCSTTGLSVTAIQGEDCQTTD